MAANPTCKEHRALRNHGVGTRHGPTRTLCAVPLQRLTCARNKLSDKTMYDQAFLVKHDPPRREDLCFAQQGRKSFLVASQLRPTRNPTAPSAKAQQS